MFTKRYLQLSKKCQDLVGCQGGILKKSVQPRQNSFIPRSSNLHTSTASGTKPSTTYQKNTQPSSHILSNRSFSGENILSSVSRREMSSATEPRVIATPRVCMHDVKTSIKVEGLSSNQPVTVRMSLTEDRGKKFCSYAHFISDKDGNVDLCTMPSLGGSYTGLVPSGLLMSLKAAPGEFKYARLLKEKIEEPLEITLTVHNKHKSVEDEMDPICTNIMERHYIAPGSKVIPVHYKSIRGQLVIPPGQGPFPGIIDMFGAAGLHPVRPALMSSHGFATLALPLFGYEGITNSLNKFDLQYFEDAVEFITSQERIIPDRCGALGLSLGGLGAVVSGTFIDKVKAVAAVSVESAFVQTTLMKDGKVLVALEPDRNILQYSGESTEEHGTRLTQEGVDTYIRDNEYKFPVHEASLDTQFYFAFGKKDMLQLYKGVKWLTNRLDEVGNKNYIVDTYEGAGHLIDAPNVEFNRTSIQSYRPPGGEETMKIYVDWGGEMSGTCDMQQMLWPKLINFFKYHIRDSSEFYQNWIRVENSKRMSKL